MCVNTCNKYFTDILYFIPKRVKLTLIYIHNLLHLSTYFALPSLKKKNLFCTPSIFSVRYLMKIHDSCK